MNCNKKCYWNYRGECCPEDEQGYDNANPNETEKCIAWIRPDFDTYFWSVYNEISDLINHRNLGELEDIRTFIKNQRNDIVKIKPTPPPVKVVFDDGGISNKIKSWFKGGK